MISPPGAIAEPTFMTLPADLADSPQLDALVPRETAGLDPTSASADGTLLVDMLAALAAIDDAPSELSRLSIYADDVSFTFFERGITGRAVSGSYRRSDQELSLGEPSFNDTPTFPIALIDADVPQRLIDAIEQRFPHTRVTSVDLDVDLSYDFGLTWYAEVEDARGRLAIVFADLDGAIVAVDDA